MSTTIAQFKTRLASKIHGQNINKVNDINGLIREAAGNVLLSIDPVETKRTSVITDGIYDRVYDYACPTDLKKDRIIDIRPQGSRSGADNFSQVYGQEFGLYADNGTFAVEDSNGIRTIKISKNATPGALLSDCSSLTGNGTWAATASASNLSVDTINKINGAGSLMFDLAAAGSSGYIENSSMNSLNLSSFPTNYSAFVPCYIPNSAVTSVTLRWGSSSSDYFSVTATTTQSGTAFQTGWNIIRFDRTAATTTGTPDTSSINYARVTVAYNGSAVSSFRVDSIMFKQPTPYEITYYSKYLFRNSSGTWIESPTAIDDSDTIVLDIDGENILLYETCLLIAQEIAGEDSSFDVAYWRQQKTEIWSGYKTANKSEAQKRRTTYYRHYNQRRR